MTRPAFSLILALVCAACSGEDHLQHVPRERTLITDCVDQGTCSGQFQDYDAFNPYLPGKVSRTGFNFLYEPLYFYNAYRDEIIPWIATGHEYNEDYTEVTALLHEKRAVVLAPSVIGLCFFVYRIGLGFCQMQ